MFTPAPKVRAVYQLCRASEQIGTKTNDGPFIAEACSVADQRKRPIVKPVVPVCARTWSDFSRHFDTRADIRLISDRLGIHVREMH